MAELAPWAGVRCGPRPAPPPAGTWARCTRSRPPSASARPRLLPHPTSSPEKSNLAPGEDAAAPAAARPATPAPEARTGPRIGVSAPQQVRSRPPWPGILTAHAITQDRDPQDLRVGGSGVMSGTHRRFCVETCPFRYRPILQRRKLRHTDSFYCARASRAQHSAQP
ncbi:uncharacterized protein AAG666_017544 [Megaptera novaeangliae]